MQAIVYQLLNSVFNFKRLKKLSKNEKMTLSLTTTMYQIVYTTLANIEKHHLQSLHLIFK